MLGSRKQVVGGSWKFEVSCRGERREVNKVDQAHLHTAYKLALSPAALPRRMIERNWRRLRPMHMLRHHDRLVPNSLAYCATKLLNQCDSLLRKDNNVGMLETRASSERRAANEFSEITHRDHVIRISH